MNKLESLLRDIITSVDPFAENQEDGINFVNSLGELLLEASGKDSIDISFVVDKVRNENVTE